MTTPVGFPLQLGHLIAGSHVSVVAAEPDRLPDKTRNLRNRRQMVRAGRGG